MDGSLTKDRKVLQIGFAARRGRFGERAAGAPFHVFAPKAVRAASGAGFERGRCWNYAVAAGDRLTDQWALADFEGGEYHLCALGPNGFFREFRGSSSDPTLEVILRGAEGKPMAGLELRNGGTSMLAVEIDDLAYGQAARKVAVPAGGVVEVALDLAGSQGWYDLGIQVPGAAAYRRRYAGHIETGEDSSSDPLMGRA